MEDKPFYGYIVIRKDDKKSITGFSASVNLDEVRSARPQPDNPASDNRDETQKSVKPEAPPTSFVGTMKHIVDASHSRSELAFILPAIKPFYPMLPLERDAIKPLEKQENIVEINNGSEIYGLSEKG